MSSPSDLTARARIRDAAIKLFAERGIDGASVRDIALAAGVSSGLLRHHFGSKDGLRDACDDYALAELSALGIQFGDLNGAFARITTGTLLLQRYLLRSTLDGSPAGNAMFDRIIEFGEQWSDAIGLKASDRRAYVAVISVMKMSMFTMREQLSRVLGEDVGEPAGWLRIAQAAIEIFATPLVTPGQAAMATQMIERMRTDLARQDTPEEQP